MGVPKRAKSAQKQPPLQKNSSNKKTKTVKTTKSVKTTSIHFPTPQTTQNPPATSLTPRTRFLHELDELTRRTTLPPHLQTILRSATSGTFRDFWKNEQRIKIGRRTIKIGFYFFTYECCRRRVPLIKTIHGVEEVLILLYTAFGYEYFFLKCRRTRLKSEVSYSGKDFICRKTHDKKKEDVMFFFCLGDIKIPITKM